jgi:hypothetical protein
MGLESHRPHPHLSRRRAQGPVKVADQLPADSPVRRFNTRVALVTTKLVGTMWCAYLFAAIDFLALPQAVHGGLFGLVQWLASFFLQLVLLSIIMVGQNVQAAASDKQAEATYNDVEALVHEVRAIQQHLIENLPTGQRGSDD